MPHKDPKKRREYMREWSRKRRKEDPDFKARNNLAAREHQRRKRKADPDAAYRYKRDHQLKSQFGISLEEYEEILSSQKGVCAICKESSIETLAVDHCHETGIVRGLLCSSCNNGLGRFKDDPELLVTAIDYLTISELDAQPPMPFTNDLHRTPHESEIAHEEPTQVMGEVTELTTDQFMKEDPRCICTYIGDNRKPDKQHRVTNSDCPVHEIHP